MTLHVVGRGGGGLFLCVSLFVFPYVFLPIGWFQFYSHGCPVLASLGVAIKVFPVIKYPSLGLTKLQFGEKIEV